MARGLIARGPERLVPHRRLPRAADHGHRQRPARHRAHRPGARRGRAGDQRPPLQPADARRAAPHRGRRARGRAHERQGRASSTCTWATGRAGWSLIRAGARTGASCRPAVFNPTHVNRRRALFDEALALAERGCTRRHHRVSGRRRARTPGARTRRWCATSTRALPADRVTVSSDGGGCLPVFDAEGRVTVDGRGQPVARWARRCATLLARGQPLERVLPAFTGNPARLLRLQRKGRLAAGGGRRPGGAGSGRSGGGGDGAGPVARAGRRAVVRGTFEQRWVGLRRASPSGDEGPMQHDAAPRLRVTVGAGLGSCCTAHASFDRAQRRVRTPLPDPPRRCILCGADDCRPARPAGLPGGRALVADGRGYIIPVGGAEEKIGDVTILRRFASLCGTDGRIAIIPTASELSDTGARYETLFQRARRRPGAGPSPSTSARTPSCRSCSRSWTGPTASS